MVTPESPNHIFALPFNFSELKRALMFALPNTLSGLLYTVVTWTDQRVTVYTKQKWLYLCKKCRVV